MCLRSPAGRGRLPQLSGVRRRQAVVRGGRSRKEMPVPLPAREGDPGDSRPREDVPSAERTERQHRGGLLRGVARDQTGHREHQVHRREHAESQQSQRGQWTDLSMLDY